ncbi:DNA topoisomerase I [Desulfurobacterium thermolithotrophum DSM 11699]|uniref:DNA topoisomerase 1 n=1 Tax=Desulfurobacterium thermolithotrophum (strain DSM 11699 / BSA) TaxID=868864 RepID=F0S425_DESTD|nr:type I DNA topoisomerase [Desulfurobacterium thermolithotrophum]ADY73597.1 DNA topoisomerase I [Desulfurobacterium thermolithotrophum DSM 11699]
MGKKKLLIVESPAKAKTIQRYLGKDFIVKASMGHVIDLPEKEFGVDIEKDFKPKYVTIKGKDKVLKEIRKAAKESEEVLLATDPDREGEAISWHIANALKRIKKEGIYRVRFHEITKKAIEEAIKNPDKIDENKVNAQQARRILDRIVGYTISPLLSKKFKKALSAGRVQSVALRLICDREEEIRKFVPKEYWTVEGIFRKETSKFPAKLFAVDGKKLDKFDIPDKNSANQLIDRAKKAVFVVTRVERKERKRKPYPPFITSTLQQEASKRFGFPAKLTMQIAQQLYEGIDLGKERVGLITYMRTDSTRVSDEAVKEVRNFIEENFGLEYLPKTKRSYETKTPKSAQDAHEAIRPTSVFRTPESVKKYLTSEQYKLYELIWKRFVASQMKDAVFNTVSADIEGNGLLFRATGSTLKEEGFLKVYPVEFEEKLLPDLNEGDKVEQEDIKGIQHFTEPPPRYTEGTLVKALEEEGVGRPSTYATIISNIIQRGYVEKEKQKLKPTELGEFINDILKKLFPKIVDVKFTANIEEELDKIEEGKKEWIELLKEFYFGEFKELLEKAERELKSLKGEEIGRECPKCGAPLLKIHGKYGTFIACSKYPECKYKESLKGEPKKTGEICPKCGGELVIKNGKYGKFIACANYPKCKYTAPLTYGKCPKCKEGDIVERRSKKGKKFFGCSRYPECDFISNKPPSEAKK